MTRGQRAVILCYQGLGRVYRDLHSELRVRDEDYIMRRLEKVSCELQLIICLSSLWIWVSFRGYFLLNFKGTPCPRPSVNSILKAAPVRVSGLPNDSDCIWADVSERQVLRGGCFLSGFSSHLGRSCPSLLLKQNPFVRSTRIKPWMFLK